MSKYASASLYRNGDGTWDVYYSNENIVPDPCFHATRFRQVELPAALDHARKWLRGKRSSFYLLLDWGIKKHYQTLKPSGILFDPFLVKTRLMIFMPNVSWVTNYRG